MILAPPAFDVHLAHLCDRVAQAFQSSVDIDDFVEITLRASIVSLILKSVRVIAADFGCELNLQAKRVQMPRGEEHVIQRLRVEMRLRSIEHQRLGGMFSAVAKFMSHG